MNERGGLSRADVCAGCVATSCLCVFEAVEWPPRSREDIAAAEARGEAWAGQSAALAL